MKSILIFSILLFATSASSHLFAQTEENKIVDIIWLKDGSRLSGTILKWELHKTMQFKLLTGAEIEIPAMDIHKVVQDVSMNAQNELTGARQSFIRTPKPYAFKEVGWYQNTSGFLNLSFYGGAGIHHAMGYRFSRLIGVGLGAGIESNDFTTVRNLIPVYAEVRGFTLPQKISPYYALKIGYGFALKNEERFTSDAKGGFMICPELGIRFGSGDVSYYVGAEYKLQNATYTTDESIFGGAMYTDKVSYRRIELRTGLLF